MELNWHNALDIPMAIYLFIFPIHAPHNWLNSHRAVLPQIGVRECRAMVCICTRQANSRRTNKQTFVGGSCICVSLRADERVLCPYLNSKQKSVKSILGECVCAWRHLKVKPAGNTHTHITSFASLGNNKNETTTWDPLKYNWIDLCVHNARLKANKPTALRRRRFNIESVHL